MPVQTIEVVLPEEIITKLDKRVQDIGTDRNRVVSEIIERGLSQRTIEELLEPFQRGFQRSGMTESELNDLIESEIKAVRAGR